MLRLAKGMIRASRALNDDFDAFKKVYDYHVTVSVPADEIRRIWQQERDSGGFALNGELTSAHWNAQMTSFFELYPSLPRIAYEDVILDRFVTQALSELGLRN